MDSITYQIGDNLYINLTNRCLNQCEFCIRYKARNLDQKYPLWLDREPTVDEVIKAIGDPSPYQQIAFVGYGEPLIRLEEVIAIAKALKLKYQGKIRIDTNGLANLFWGRNVLPELKGLIDIISISLNAENAELYDRICSSLYGLAAFPAVLDFIKEAKKYIPQVEVTVVDLPIVDKEKCRQIATDLGAAFRVRPYYEETYIH
jgi:TatD family-associated radical SAM protein